MKLVMDTSKDCSRAWEAMPWALQVSDSSAQDDWLAQHLARCDSCRTEFELQSRLRQAISLPPEVTVDPSAGLRRLMARLDAPAIPEDVPGRVRSTSWVTRALVAAVLIQAVGIGVLGAKLWSENERPAYRTLSQGASPAASGAIHVVPSDSMKLADWDALLRSLRLQVVSGPNDVGAYTVAPIDAAATSADTLRRLRASHGIRLAELVTTAP